ncbi:EAL domain-containing protein [Actinoplanes aureus]|uniref:EAL domain-containing protein n=1 Tax=Actinoplanes aureus TaxID=2792083 RepID=A0A931CAG3_9ACTN|nr:EAL domain-containing protein [Actinoplanes aureus]MBG0566454.1 EAL domain-containing protein [Actinoplanes aureus]
MDLDDILALAETREPSPLELARARRVARTVQSEYDLSLAEGYEIIVDTDPVDPLTADIDEPTRIARAAQLVKRGTITWTTGSGKTAGLLSWSDEMAMIFGYAPGTLRLTPERLVELVHPADASAVRAAVETAWGQRRPGEVTFRAVHPGGSVRYVHCHLEILTTAGEPSGIIATGHDVTAVELARQERRRLATRSEMLCTDAAAQDLVTGLPTRGYFTDEVDRARRTTDGALIVVATEPATRLSHAITDQGHEQVTAEVAGLLRTIVGSDLTCGLVGPGLWGVLVAAHQEGTETTGALARRIVDTFRRHLFTVQQRTLRLNAWAGVVRFTSGVPATGFDLLVDGEHAAREARRKGVAVHVLDRPAQARERTNRCRSRVVHAVATDRFALYAQPIVDLALNQITRHEILLRVRGNTGELVAPWAFLDMAERVGEILAVDKWVIDHALELIGQGAQTSHYQVNISGKSLADPGLLTYVSEAIRRHRVKPECLTFEITETALIENRNEALAFATGIREIGCHLALDDFGTGYAALAYLKYLPVDLVKIDGVFIVDLCQSPPDQAVVSKLVELCHTLGIRVAAECVQDEQTVTLLKEYGVDFAQGYRTGRPAPIAASLKHEVNTIELELRFPERRIAMG